MIILLELISISNNTTDLTFPLDGQIMIILKETSAFILSKDHMPTIFKLKESLLVAASFFQFPQLFSTQVIPAYPFLSSIQTL
jgi:hypothetical protein